MLRWRPLALGMASSLIFVAAAEAQQARSPARRHRRAAAGDVRPQLRPPPAPQDPLGIALQQKLTATTKGRADEAEAQDRAALAAFYAGRIYAPVWVSSNGLSAKAAAAIAEFGKANDWGLERRRLPGPPGHRAGRRCAVAGCARRCRARHVAHGAEVRTLCTRRPHRRSGDAAQLLPRSQAAAARAEDGDRAARRCRRGRRLPAQAAPAAAGVREAAPEAARDAHRRGRDGGRDAAERAAARARAAAIRRSPFCASA